MARSIDMMKHPGRGDLLKHTKDPFSEIFVNIQVVNNMDGLS